MVRGVRQRVDQVRRSATHLMSKKHVRFFNGDEEVTVTNVTIRGTGCLLIVFPYLIGILVFAWAAIYTAVLVIETFMRGLGL